MAVVVVVVVFQHVVVVIVVAVVAHGRCFVHQNTLNGHTPTVRWEVLLTRTIVDDPRNQRRPVRIETRDLNPRHDGMRKGELESQALDLLQFNVGIGRRCLVVTRIADRHGRSGRMPHPRVDTAGRCRILVWGRRDPGARRYHVMQIALEAEFTRTRRQTDSFQGRLEGLAVQVRRRLLLLMMSRRGRRRRQHFGQSTFLMAIVTLMSCMVGSIVLKGFGH